MLQRISIASTPRRQRVVILFVVLAMIVGPVALYILWILCFCEHTPAQKTGAAFCRILVILFLSALIISCIYSFFSDLFKKESPQEQLYQISEEIGIDGVLDFVLEHWNEDEVIEYILSN